MLRRELDKLPDNVSYTVEEFYAKEVVDNVWETAARIKVIIPDMTMEHIECITRFTGCFNMMKKEGIICSCHIFKGNYDKEKKEYMPITLYSGNNMVDRKKTEQTVLDIMCKAMPGGIVAGYKTEGFPICFVNDKYLELLGYSSYEEYFDDTNGMALNSIHPDDREMVIQTINTCYDAGEEYGIEYQIQSKDGRYIDVYDIGKKITTLDGRDIIVCVLVDVTETVQMRKALARESAIDELTGIYNRRGGIRIMEQHLNEGEPYAFAIFDIDNLKLLNDEYNHKVGDTALKKFAQLMKELFDDETTLSRFGGDEFISFIPKKLEPQYVETVLSNLQREYNAFIKANYPKSNSSVSIGCVTGTTPTTFDMLYQKADELMYGIKKNGKNGCRIVELKE